MWTQLLQWDIHLLIHYTEQWRIWKPFVYNKQNIECVIQEERWKNQKQKFGVLIDERWKYRNYGLG